MTDIEQVRAKARHRMQSLMPELMARVDWPRERLDAYRQDQLRGILASAIAGSAWHRERLSGIDLTTFRLQDLPSLPTMTKNDLMGSFDRISTEPRITLERCEEHLDSGGMLLDGRFTVTASGGTSGTRAVSAGRVDTLIDMFTAGMTRFVIRWGIRTGAMLRPSPPFILAAAPGPHGSNILRTLFGRGAGPTVSVADPLDAIVEALNAAAPEHVAVYSSFIPHLAEEARAGRLRIRPKILSPVAESFLPEHEAAASEVWDCVLISSWGASEVALLGAGSGFDPGMLLIDDMTIVEPVDASGRPVPPGVRADKLFVTPLTPRLLPIVRYELTDQLTVLEEPPSCGSSFTRVSYVRGRQDEEFTYAEGLTVHPHVFRTVLGRRKAITEYQVEQTPRGAAVRVVLAPGATAIDGETLTFELTSSLARLGIPEPQVVVQSVTAIPRIEASSKLRRFLPLAADAVRARSSPAR